MSTCPECYSSIQRHLYCPTCMCPKERELRAIINKLKSQLQQQKENKMKSLYRRFMNWLTGIQWDGEVKGYQIISFLKKINYQPTLSYMKKGNQDGNS
jgi:hypothetical protein